MDEIDTEYNLIRGEADEQLKVYLDQEDTNSHGVIGDTYLKLSDVIVSVQKG